MLGGIVVCPRDHGVGDAGERRAAIRLATAAGKAFFPPPDPDGALWFGVLIEHGSTELAVTGAVEVAALRLPSGGILGVTVRRMRSNRHYLEWPAHLGRPAKLSLPWRLVAVAW